MSRRSISSQVQLSDSHHFVEWCDKQGIDIENDKIDSAINNLKKNGYISKNEIDSYELVEACKQFQDDHGLKVDGIPGDITRETLEKSTNLISSFFFPTKLTIQNLAEIKSINRSREALSRFYILFLIAFLTILLVWPFLARFLVLLHELKTHNGFLDILNNYKLPKALNFKSDAGGILTLFLSTLPTVFIVSLVSERAIEILLTYAFGWDKDRFNKKLISYENFISVLTENPELLADSDILPSKNIRTNIGDAERSIPLIMKKINELKRVLIERNKVVKKLSYALSLTIGLLAAIAGVRIIEPLVHLNNSEPGLRVTLFRWLDICLTSIVISGGSEIVHRLFKSAVNFSIFSNGLRNGIPNISIPKVPTPSNILPSSIERKNRK